MQPEMDSGKTSPFYWCTICAKGFHLKCDDEFMSECASIVIINKPEKSNRQMNSNGVFLACSHIPHRNFMGGHCDIDESWRAVHQSGCDPIQELYRGLMHENIANSKHKLTFYM